jgi:hypothetical protein
MMTDWIEQLRCPKCAMTGNAEFFAIATFRNGFRKVPEGSKLCAGPYGEDFRCVTCEIPVTATNWVG